MADKGTVAEFAQADIRALQGPRDRLAYGTLSITGTSRKNEIAASTTLRVFDVRMRKLMAVESRADGSFGAYNLSAGRYFVVVDGHQSSLPGVYAVDVS